ncbi:hypothetical protein ACGF0D_10565 [Kitasatospora sp. NPDC048298]|uniref:hypothetical protein n=1 Tax=Kitasatospora sp. NPDC048298 TaxID=3364049 RepID=UPI0037183BC1
MTATPPPTDADLDARAAALLADLEAARADIRRAERRADRALRRGDDPETARANQREAQQRADQLANELEGIRYERQDRAAARTTTS